MSGIRVLVANKTKAEMYDLPTPQRVEAVRTFVNPAGQKREVRRHRRPGRVMNRSGGVRRA